LFLSPINRKQHQQQQKACAFSSFRARFFVASNVRVAKSRVTVTVSTFATPDDPARHFSTMTVTLSWEKWSRAQRVNPWYNQGNALPRGGRTR
jgi:hypothetical protein